MLVPVDQLLWKAVCSCSLLQGDKGGEESQVNEQYAFRSCEVCGCIPWLELGKRDRKERGEGIVVFGPFNNINTQGGITLLFVNL